MEAFSGVKAAVTESGFAVINDVYDQAEIDNILQVIDDADHSNSTFRKAQDLFAIRQFLKEVPRSIEIIFNEKLAGIISEVFDNDYFITKSIYFDKPAMSNWFVAYHQDLTISVDRKETIDGFGPWTTKHNQFAVQPPLSILEGNFTVRIHLDDTSKDNGALKVIPGSHRTGICRPESINLDTDKEVVCAVRKGGIMLMHPLLLHSSGRTINNCKRRVIHVEFSKQCLPGTLQWAEYLPLTDALGRKQQSVKLT